MKESLTSYIRLRALLKEALSPSSKTKKIKTLISNNNLHIYNKPK